MTVGRGSSLWALVFVCGCGGGAGASGPARGAESNDPPAKAADPPAAAVPADETAEGASGAPAPKEGAAAEEAAGALEGKDLEAVLQVLLSDPGLLDKLHLKQPGRSPLKLSGDQLPAKLGVIAGSHEVKVVPAPKTKKEAVLVFTKVERTGTQAKLFYHYDIEGLEGRATFALKDGRWDLSANRLIEK